MIVGAAVSFVLLLGWFTWLLYKSKIGDWVFCTLTLGSLFAGVVVARLPDISEVQIAGNTLTLLQQETDQAKEVLSALRKLSSDMLSMEFKRIAIPDFPGVPGDAVKAEEFDQLMFVLDILPKKEQLNEELREDVTKACEAVLSRQHFMTGIYFVFSEHDFEPGGGFARADLLPHEDNFRTLTSDEIEAELDELHRNIDDTPGQSLENDKNRELRLEAVENYKQIVDVCSALTDG